MALTKRDLVDDEGAALARDGRRPRRWPGRGWRRPRSCEVSARTGQGLDELRAALRAARRRVARRAPRAATRLPVDRVFSLRGIGTVVTGTLWVGSMPRATA